MADISRRERRTPIARPAPPSIWALLVLGFFSLLGGPFAAHDAVAQTAPPPGAPAGPIPGVYYNPYCINGVFPNGKKCNAYGPRAKKELPYGVDSGGRKNKKGGLYQGGSPTKGMKTGGWRRSKSRGGRRGGKGGGRRRSRHR